MVRIKWASFILLVIFLPVHAFTTVDEQIDHYLEILEYDTSYKITTLERLQWSGLTDPRLYDEIEKQVIDRYQEEGLSEQSRDMLSHLIRALGYSGNDKYRGTLDTVSKGALSNRHRKHAKKALLQLEQFISWNRLLVASDYSVEGKSVEVATYMKMLSTNDVMVQRLAARAIFHERQYDSDLLAMAAEKLEAMYLQDGLPIEAQDTAAWLCKAIGQSGWSEYKELLKKVAANTPYKKVKKHAKMYTR